MQAVGTEMGLWVLTCVGPAQHHLYTISGNCHWTLRMAAAAAVMDHPPPPPTPPILELPMGVVKGLRRAMRGHEGPGTGSRGWLNSRIL